VRAHASDFDADSDPHFNREDLPPHTPPVQNLLHFALSRAAKFVNILRFRLSEMTN